MLNIGHKLKTLRKRHNLSMDELANEMKKQFPDINLDKSMISRWESGINDPSLEYAKYLSIYFNISLDDLTTNVEDEMRDKIRSVLVSCRLKSGMTQSEVGKAVGKSDTAVASWEQGLSLPNPVTLYQLAELYGKGIEYMYGDEK